LEGKRCKPDPVSEPKHFASKDHKTEVNHMCGSSVLTGAKGMDNRIHKTTERNASIKIEMMLKVGELQIDYTDPHM